MCKIHIKSYGQSLTEIALILIVISIGAAGAVNSFTNAVKDNTAAMANDMAVSEEGLFSGEEVVIETSGVNGLQQGGGGHDDDGSSQL